MNPYIAKVEPSLIRELNALKKPGDLDLGLGQPRLMPDLSFLPALMERFHQEGCRYTPNLGLLELRKKVGNYLGASSDSVCITNGSQEALYLALKSVFAPDQGDLLIVEPAYSAYAKIAQMEQITYRTVRLSENFKPDPKRVLEAVDEKTKMVLLASPCNPSGAVWTREQLKQLQTGLPESCYLFVDEVYRELQYDGDIDFHCALANEEFSHKTLVCHGVSKACALTGIRLGWLVAPQELMGNVHRLHQLSMTASSTLSQWIGLELFDEKGDLIHQQQDYRAIRPLIEKALGESGLTYTPLQGAFYTLIQVPSGGDDRVWSRRLLEEARVVAVPASIFGAPGWLRLSWAVESDDFVRAVAKIAGLFSQES